MLNEAIPLITVKEFPPKQIVPLYKLYISEVFQKPKFLETIEKYNIQICGEITFIHRVSNKFFAITVKDETGEILAKRFEKEDRRVILEELQCMKPEPNKLIHSYQFEDFVFEASRLNVTEKEGDYQESAQLVSDVIDWLATEVAPSEEHLTEGRKIIMTGVFQERDEEKFISIYDYRMLNNDLEFQDITEEFKYLHKVVYK